MKGGESVCCPSCDSALYYIETIQYEKVLDIWECKECPVTLWHWRAMKGGVL